MGITEKSSYCRYCATYANAIFDNYHLMNSTIIVIGSSLFAFQIYGDFSGYSDGSGNVKIIWN
jgi:D-alanyl-lipoteichoic acid acyltransferase DltB (MBOAT superfamily)